MCACIYHKNIDNYSQYDYNYSKKLQTSKIKSRQDEQERMTKRPWPTNKYVQLIMNRDGLTEYFIIVLALCLDASDSLQLILRIFPLWSRMGWSFTPSNFLII